MGVDWMLVNYTKKERVTWEVLPLPSRVPAMLSDPVVNAIIVRYLFENRGDQIALVPDVPWDDKPQWPFPGPYIDCWRYKDVLNDVIAVLVEQKVIREEIDAKTATRHLRFWMDNQPRAID
jgi:hypothetical protein